MLGNSLRKLAVDGGGNLNIPQLIGGLLIIGEAVLLDLSEAKAVTDPRPIA